MSLMVRSNTLILWHDVVQEAEQACQVRLENQLEAYLVALLMRYSNKPDVVKQLVATSWLDALKHDDLQRQASLQHVGDQCLLVSGLFPGLAEKRRVNIKYFVELGRTAYTSVSATTNDVFNALALQFVLLMDVLQSIRQYPDLLPLEAYEQWHAVGSQHALKILRHYSDTRKKS